MPKKNLRQNTGFQLNPAMKMVTNATGSPSASERFAANNQIIMDDIAQKTDNFANMVIDSRSGAYSKVVNNPDTGLGYKTNTSRQFGQGTNKKYPYLYSAFDQDANSDKNVLFSRPGSSDRGVGHVVRDSKDGSIISADFTTSNNTARRDNYLNEADILRREFQGSKDKKSLKLYEQDAKWSSDTYDNIIKSVGSGNIQGAREAIELAKSQYNSGDALVSPYAGFRRERFLGPIGNTSLGNSLSNLDLANKEYRGGMNLTNYIGKNATDYGIKGFNVTNPVKFRTRRMISGFDDLQNRAESAQKYSNLFAKEGVKGKRFEINNKIFFDKLKNNFDTKSGK